MADPRFDRVRALFEGALDLSPTDRAAFLDRECGEDKELRREVESLLAANEEADGFLEPPSGFALPTAELESASSRFLPEEEIGGYRLIRELGRGGRGVVYLAAEPESDKLVALKVLGAGLLPSAVAVERFRGESEATDPLNHPGIVKIRRSAEENGRPFLIMDFIEGHTLADEILLLRHAVHGLDLPESLRERQPVLPVEGEQRAVAVAKLVGQIAEALQHAHANNVLHRDVKPQNILLDEEGQPHLIDFGLAKVERELDLTQTGAVEGTPNYMSPEQVRAERDGIDARSDIYSLGVVLYELLTLKRPFDAPTAGQVMHNITATLPQRIRRISPSVPSKVELVCSMAIEKRRQDRYPSAQVFAADLAAAASGQAIIARQPSLPTQVRRSIERRPVPWAAAASIFVTAALAFGLWGGSSQVGDFEKEVDRWYTAVTQKDADPKSWELRKTQRLASLVEDQSEVTRGNAWQKWLEMEGLAQSVILDDLRAQISALRPVGEARTLVNLPEFRVPTSSAGSDGLTGAIQAMERLGLNAQLQADMVAFATAPRLVLDFSYSGGDELVGVELARLKDDGLHYDEYLVAEEFLLPGHFKLEAERQYRARVESAQGGRFVIDVFPVREGQGRYLKIGPVPDQDFELVTVPGGDFDVEALFPVMALGAAPGNRIVSIPEFTIMRRLISVGEYVEYLAASESTPHEWYSTIAVEKLATWSRKLAGGIGLNDGAGVAAWFRMRVSTGPESRVASSGGDLPAVPAEYDVDELLRLAELTMPRLDNAEAPIDWDTWMDTLVPEIDRELAGIDVGPYGLRFTSGGLREWVSTPATAAFVNANLQLPEFGILLGGAIGNRAGLLTSSLDEDGIGTYRLALPVILPRPSERDMGLRCVAEWGGLP